VVCDQQRCRPTTLRSFAHRYYQGIFETNLLALSISNLQTFNFSNASTTVNGAPRQLDLDGFYSPDVVSHVGRAFARRMALEQKRFFLYYPMILPHSKARRPRGRSREMNQRKGGATGGAAAGLPLAAYLCNCVFP
jgi:hypothetical protein